MEEEHRKIVEEIYEQRRELVFNDETQTTDKKIETERKLKAAKKELTRYLLEHPEELKKKGGKKAL